MRTWLGPDADDDARDLVRRMQLHALVVRTAAGDVDARELPVTLSSLTMPITVVAGSLDQPFFVRTAHALVRRLPDARLVELPWAGHLPSLERPEETHRLVRAALAGD